jgi:uncharacterized protein (UPF0335 family)
MRKKDEPAAIGDNSGAVSSERLKSFVSRIEKLETDKSEVITDIREVYSESKATGFSAATIRQIVRLRRMEESKRKEQEELLSLYMSALNMEN